MKFLKSTRFGTCSPSAMRSGAISRARARCASTSSGCVGSSIQYGSTADNAWHMRSEEHTSELQSLRHLVCRLLLEKKNKPAFTFSKTTTPTTTTHHASTAVDV